MSLCLHRPRKPGLLVFSKFLLGWTALVLGCSFGLNSTHAWAQDATEKKAEPAKPEEIELTTDDGLELKATYFPGGNAQESIPVLLLHAFKGNRKDFTKEDEGLAPFLQKELGCAVIVPDLRGHGDSTKIRVSEKRMDDLKGKKLSPAHISAMVREDARAVKDFTGRRTTTRP